MNRNLSPPWLAEALALGMLLLLLGVVAAHSRASILRNAGFIRLNHAAVTNPPQQSTLQAARHDFERAHEIDVTNSSVRRGLGLTLGLGDQVEAATEMLQTPPINYPIILFLGDHFRREQDDGRAIVWYKAALELAPEDAGAWQRLGLAYESQGNLEAARSAFFEGWQLEMSDNARHLARVLVNMDELAEAEKVLSQAIDDVAESEDRVSWWVQLGDLRRMEGRIPEAISTYRTGLEEYPNNSFLHYGLGQSYVDSGAPVDLALEEFYRADANDGSGSAAFAVAELLTSEGRFTDSWTWFEKAISMNLNNPRWLAVYVNSARVGGNLDLALRIGEPAVMRFSDYGPLYSQLAAVYQQLKDWGKAVKAIQLAIDHIPNPSADLWLRAAQIYEQAGSVDEARAAYDLVLTRNPDEQRARTGLARLNESTGTPNE